MLWSTAIRCAVVTLAILFFTAKVFGEEVKHTVKRNMYLWNNSTPIHERVSRSRRHCAQLCSVTDRCVSANYDQQTSTCQLLESSLAWLFEQPGNDAIVVNQMLTGKQQKRFPINYLKLQVTFEGNGMLALIKTMFSPNALLHLCNFFSVGGMVGVWPLSGTSYGRNLMRDGPDLQLHGVLFTKDAGPWRSSPAQFQGSEQSYAASSGDDLLITHSFSWMGAVWFDHKHLGSLLNCNLVDDNLCPVCCYIMIMSMRPSRMDHATVGFTTQSPCPLVSGTS